jgi:hypothetical protein
MMKISDKKQLKTIMLVAGGGLFLIICVAIFLIARTWGRTMIQFDIHQNKKIIHLSNFAEPPQFAIWLEDPVTGELKSVFVTHRVATGDWEGKANVPVALPQWYKLFKGEKKLTGTSTGPGRSDMAISGATPKGDYFSLRVEVKPGSQWICWIEMNLAGDFNDAFPEVDLKTLREDEFSNGQPALLFRAEIKAVEGMKFKPEIVSQATWQKGAVSVEPVSPGVTTARDVFDDISVSIIRPKPKLIDKTRIKDL